MKTIIYNPSELELDMVHALAALEPEIEKKMNQISIKKVEKVTSADNPILVIKLLDKDGDLHELVVQVIQRPDHLAKL